MPRLSFEPSVLMSESSQYRPTFWEVCPPRVKSRQEPASHPSLHIHRTLVACDDENRVDQCKEDAYHKQRSGELKCSTFEPVTVAARLYGDLNRNRIHSHEAKISNGPFVGGSPRRATHRPFGLGSTI